MLSLLLALQALTYYVSPTGNDNRAGTTPQAAWRTLGKVSSTSFAAGSVIALEGGKVHPGKLFLQADDKGTSAQPIVVKSYGVGRATISASNGYGFEVYNTAGVVIKDLVVRGSGAGNIGSGINVFTDLPGDVLLEHIWIENVDVSGFGRYGIVVGSWNGRTGYRNVTLRNLSVHTNLLAGLTTFAQPASVHRNVAVSNVRAFDNSGVAGAGKNTGSGIALGGVDGGRVQYSVAYNNGRLNTFSAGPVGIWAYNSANVVLERNESYNNRTSGANDGGGFDLGQLTTNSVMQFNYSHGNDGPGFLLDGYSNGRDNVGNVVRYNISENDDRRGNHAAIAIFGRVRNADLYHNTVYLRPATAARTRAIQLWNAGGTLYGENITIRNNILYGSGAAVLVEVPRAYLTSSPGIRFEGNAYFSDLQARYWWNGLSYASLAAWRVASGQERIAGIDLGSDVDPGLTSPGQGGTIGNAQQLATLTAYKLRSGSPLINRGLRLGGLVTLPLGPTDFWSQPTPLPTDSVDVGAHEWRE